MKNVWYSLFFAFFFVLVGSAQSPESFNYQAVIRDSGGNVIANQNVGLQFTIHQTSATGATVYQESFASTTNEFGLVNLQVGKGSVSSGTMAGIDWGSGPYFLETSVDVAGGTSYVSMGTSQLLSVPYALYAKNSGGNYWEDSTSKEGISYAGGNVVIGQKSIEPYDKLYVLSNEANENATNIIMLNRNADTQTRMVVSNDLFNSMVFGLNSSNSPYGANEGFLWYFNNFDFKIGVGAAERMRFKPDGKIGIGTTNPGSQLQVTGGDVFIEDVNSGVIMKSPDGNCWRLTVNNDGTPNFTSITCP